MHKNRTSTSKCYLLKVPSFDQKTPNKSLESKFYPVHLLTLKEAPGSKDHQGEEEVAGEVIHGCHHHTWGAWCSSRWERVSENYARSTLYYLC